MAGEVTETYIANLALSRLGIGRIESITATDIPTARACFDAYYQARNEELEAHDWRFSRTRWEIAEAVAAPAFGYSHAFQRPPEMMRLNDEDPSPYRQVRDWVLEGDKILANQEGPLQVRGNERVENTARFNPFFVRAVAMRMAWWMAPRLRGADFPLSEINNDYLDAIADGLRQRALEGPPEQVNLGSAARARRGYGAYPSPFYRPIDTGNG